MDRHFVPSETQGFWRTFPFQREIADAMGDQETERVTVIKSARVGFTKMLTGVIAFRIATNPGNLLIYQPSDEDARQFSKEDLQTAFDATPAMAGRIAEAKSRDSHNTLLHKLFSGGFLRISGSHSGRGFRRVTADLVAYDEIDAYPPSAGAEGDQIELGDKRLHTAPFPKSIRGSSPKLEANSKILRSWEDSDQRDRYLPCPHCDFGQRLRWGGKDHDYGIKWPDGRPQEAFYLCEHCHCEIQHHQLGEMEAHGEWVAAKPERSSLHKGFRIWAAYSPFPKAAWGELATEFLRLKDDPLTLQVFVNTVLGEPYKERGKSPSEAKLMARRETYPVRVSSELDADGSPKREAMVPRGALVLTSFTDVQEDRIEVGVEGWGVGEENWKLEYRVIHGDPTAKPVFEELFDFLRTPWLLEDGGLDFIRSSGIDSGYSTQSVCAFVRPRQIYALPNGRRAYLWATKGRSGTGPVWPAAPGKQTKYKTPIYTVHVDAAKDVIFARTIGSETPGPGYVHFPSHFGEDYFRQLTAEHAITKTDRAGRPLRAYEMKAGRRRNEALDIAVGNYAALCALYAMGLSLERLAKARSSPQNEPPPQAPPPTSPTPPPRHARPAVPPRAPRVIRSNWMSR